MSATDFIAAALPRIVWVELTSKCPFNCIFCSRRTRRGTGEHLDFGLYKSLMRQLDSPAIIRLNYSGESIHYPHLTEAIHLAKSTGASTELVSAFASASDSDIQEIVEAGLDRLTISLHTMQADEFKTLYGFSSLDCMRERISRLHTLKKLLGTCLPSVDFAFVAMNRNLDQLGPVAAYARDFGVRDIAIHPVIRRDPIPETFTDEIEFSTPRQSFKDKLNEIVHEVRNSIPDLRITVCNPGFDTPRHLDSRPIPYPTRLPRGSRILTCDQNPWETAHILSNGDVVFCEVQDRQPLGNLNRESLSQIWHGTGYRDRRRLYASGSLPECSECPWKVAYIASPVKAYFRSSEEMNAQLARGWYDRDDCGTLWSQKESVLILSNPERLRFVQIEGALPPSPNRGENILEVFCNGDRLGRIENSGQSLEPFSCSFESPFEATGTLAFTFRTRTTFCPTLAGVNRDARDLGFALHSLDLSATIAAKRKTRRRIPRFSVRNGRLRLLKTTLQLADSMNKLLARSRTIPRMEDLGDAPGVSVIIPERGNCGHLTACLNSLKSARAEVDEPIETIVMVNGSSPDDYRELSMGHPDVRWFYYPAALSFSRLIWLGLKAARYEWVYLLNNDMVLDRQALREVVKWRGRGVFAVASQIFFKDSRRRREETGWTNCRMTDGIMEIFDVEPEDESVVRGGLYAGGGSSLFQKRVLRRVLDRADPYQPFYWEDAEWGVRAWKLGYEVLFSPMSKAWHEHRATISKYYSRPEVERIFNRNRLQFQMRNAGGIAERMFARIGELDDRSFGELLNFRNIWHAFKARLRAAFYPFDESCLRFVHKKFYFQPVSKFERKPRILVVSPYAVYPSSHGGAVRMRHLIHRLSAKYEVVLLSDEVDEYSKASQTSFQDTCAVHLVGGRVEQRSEKTDRISRIRTHSHPILTAELRRRLACDQPEVVQIEFIELAKLVESRRRNSLWSIDLHDVTHKGDESAEDHYEAQWINRYDIAVVCSAEDRDLLKTRHGALVPNGVDLSQFQYESSATCSDLLFMGPFRYEPNLEGIRKFLETVFPKLRSNMPGLQLRILGGDGAFHKINGKGVFQQPGVTVLDRTSDPEPFLRNCAVTINPLSGTRGSSIKLLESIAAGRVCVTTRDAARGFAQAGFSSLVIVEAVEDFYEPLAHLLTNPQYRTSLEKPDRTRLASYSWDCSGDKLIDLYEKHRKPNSSRKK